MADSYVFREGYIIGLPRW